MLLALGLFVNVEAHCKKYIELFLCFIFSTCKSNSLALKSEQKILTNYFYSFIRIKDMRIRVSFTNSGKILKNNF